MLANIRREKILSTGSTVANQPALTVFSPVTKKLSRMYIMFESNRKRDPSLVLKKGAFESRGLVYHSVNGIINTVMFTPSCSRTKPFPMFFCSAFWQICCN